MTQFELDEDIEILGTWWSIEVVTEEDDPRLATCNGLTDNTSKVIHICQIPPAANCSKPDVFIKKVIRHEIVHAFMFESGLAESWEHKEYGQEELVVDWIAMQFHKIQEVIEKVYDSLTMREE